MDPDNRDLLEPIGGRLNWGKYPRIYNGGMISPSTSTVATNPLGKELSNVRSGSCRSTTGSWQRASGRQGPPDRPRPSGQTAPVIDPGLSQKYRKELNAVHDAYPGAECWLQDGGMWLKSESLLIAGLEKSTTFLTAIPFARGMIAKSWAFWTSPVHCTWIGPRHTNFPDGSICAFEQKDRTWIIGDDLITLLDLYTLWALRHLHLETFGRWPGHQSVPFPYERLQEFQDSEHCGCDRSEKLYADCCKPRDLRRDIFEEFWKFDRLTDGGTRRPPSWVRAVLADQEEPPIATDSCRPSPFGAKRLARELRESTAARAYRTS